jgi:redox-sensitive bicupin YhaK (pirin superfamily)
VAPREAHGILALVQGVEVRRSADRFTTVAPARPGAAAGWAATHHSFSFGEHYDPDNVGFGPVVALNDETVRAGEGYPDHLHRDVEIVTWVLSGTLAHADSAGHVGTVGAGVVQRLSAGSGVTHTEGATGDAAVHFLQTWVRPDETGTPPAYALAAVDPDALASSWVPVASGSEPQAVVDLRSRGTTLWVTRLAAGERRALPESSTSYLLLAQGSAEVDGIGRLEAGDALVLTRPAPLVVTALGPAELLVWTFA